MKLSTIETRILGCLLEKERLTPENYPLSLNALTNACNQTTNREPVTAFSEKEIEDTLFALREKKFATVIFGAGARVQKYRHNLPDHYELTRQETALICVLLLRGPQTPGELRIRTERMAGFASVEEVVRVLEELTRDDAPLVQKIPAQAGQKEDRYAQLLGEEPEPTFPAHLPRTAQPGRIEQLEAEIALLRGEMDRLRTEFDAFRSQF